MDPKVRGPNGARISILKNINNLFLTTFERSEVTPGQDLRDFWPRLANSCAVAAALSSQVDVKVAIAMGGRFDGQDRIPRAPLDRSHRSWSKDLGRCVAKKRGMGMGMEVMVCAAMIAGMAQPLLGGVATFKGLGSCPSPCGRWGSAPHGNGPARPLASLQDLGSFAKVSNREGRAAPAGPLRLRGGGVPKFWRWLSERYPMINKVAAPFAEAMLNYTMIA